LERRYRSRLNASLDALRPREQLIADAVVVKLLISSRNRAWFVYGLFEKMGKGCR
jgi:hypothetical protein